MNVRLLNICAAATVMQAIDFSTRPRFSTAKRQNDPFPVIN